jgi:hypothetical protein
VSGDGRNGTWTKVLMGCENASGILHQVSGEIILSQMG